MLLTCCLPHGETVDRKFRQSRRVSFWTCRAIFARPRVLRRGAAGSPATSVESLSQLLLELSKRANILCIVIFPHEDKKTGGTLWRPDVLRDILVKCYYRVDFFVDRKDRLLILYCA